MDTSKARWARDYKLTMKLVLGGDVIAMIIPVENSSPRKYAWGLSDRFVGRGECDSEYAAQRAVRRALREMNDE